MRCIEAVALGVFEMADFKRHLRAILRGSTIKMKIDVLCHLGCLQMMLGVQDECDSNCTTKLSRDGMESGGMGQSQPWCVFACC